MNKELLQQRELLESFAETIPPIIFGNLMERDWETAKKCVEIAQEYAEKENKELQEKITQLEIQISQLLNQL